MKKRCGTVYAHCWITVNDILLDSLHCFSGDSYILSSFEGLENDTIKVYAYSETVDPASQINHSSAYSDVWHATCSLVVDTSGILILDNIVQYQNYDYNGNLIGVKDPNNFVSNITYDNLSRVDQITLPGSYMPFLWDPDLGTNDDTLFTFYPTLDGVHQLQDQNFITGCSSQTLQAFYFDRYQEFLYYTPLFMFGDLDFIDIDYVDSAFLVLECTSGSGEVKINRYENQDVINCGDSAYYPIFSSSYCFPVSLGEVKINVTSHVLSWKNNIDSNEVFAFGLQNCDELNKIYFASSEHDNSSYHPKLEIYTHTNETPQLDDYKFYSLNLDYDDFISDSDPVSVSTEIVYNPVLFPQTSESHFDEFGRLVRSDVYVNQDSTVFTTTEYDYADRVILQHDQLNNSTTMQYDILDRNTSIDPPGLGILAYGYSGLTGPVLELDTLFNMKHDGVFRNISSDENNNIVISYSDILGQLRLKRTILDDTTSINTYFDYDDWGNLITVIKPEGDSVNYRYNSLGQLTKEWAAGTCQ